MGNWIIVIEYLLPITYTSFYFSYLSDIILHLESAQQFLQNNVRRNPSFVKDRTCTEIFWGMSHNYSTPLPRIKCKTCELFLPYKIKVRHWERNERIKYIRSLVHRRKHVVQEWVAVRKVIRKNGVKKVWFAVWPTKDSIFELCLHWNVASISHFEFALQFLAIDHA